MVLPSKTSRSLVLDTETTGLNPQTDEILAIGAVRMIGSRILVGATFFRLVQPNQSSWDATVPVHRILPTDVESALPIQTVLPEFFAFCAESVLVGHKVYDIDRQFLARTGQPAKEWLAARSRLWLDTSQVARWLAKKGQHLPGARAPAQPTHLTALAQHYNIPIPARHHALADAFVTAQIWQRQLHQLQACGLSRLRDLKRLGLT